MNPSFLVEVLTKVQMQMADKIAIQSGINSADLMEAAGMAVVREIRKRWTRRNLVVLIGPGNNGGDGFVVARLFSELGWPVRIGLYGRLDHLVGDASLKARLWNGQVEILSEDLLSDCGLVIDALFGIGLSRPLEGKAKLIIKRVNELRLPCVAVDIPSGIDGNTGAVLGVAPRSKLTVTFFRKKSGHLLLPGREISGHTVVADIGIPETVLSKVRPKIFENEPRLWVDNLSVAQPTDNKYTQGHAVIVGGSNMIGAARLAAMGARRVGAGMLTLVAPKNVRPIYQAGESGNLVVGTSDRDSFKKLLSQQHRNAVLVGPGNGVTKFTKNRVRVALKSKLPVVLDADALTVFEGESKRLFSLIEGPCILTPHEGEFNRIFNIKGDRVTRCVEASIQSNAVVVLKGFDTIIANPLGRVTINTNAPPMLATAGSGDVLAGIILGFLAQGVNATDAACAGVWLQGEAAKRLGYGMIAEDLSGVLPTILNEIL